MAKNSAYGNVSGETSTKTLFFHYLQGMPTPETGDRLRAFIYDRNSRIGREGSTSTDDQSTENRRFCESRDWIVAAEFTDPGRGASRYSNAKRPDFDEMIRRLEAGIRPRGRHAECDVLVVWAASRATRDMHVYLRLRDLCERSKVQLCYNGTIYDLSKGSDRFVTGLGALQAEFEADNIRDGILRTTRANAERGRPHGRTPFGFHRIYDERTGALLRQEADAPAAQIVREASERVAAGESLREVARDFNRRGVTPPSSSEWVPEKVRSMILKPSNIGERQHQGEVVGQAQWDGIVDEATYYACVQLLEDPARRTQRSTAIKHLLSGLPLCGLCPKEVNAVLRPVAHTPDGAKVYSCRRCFGVSIRVPMLDDYVQAAFLAHVERPEFAEALSVDGGDEQMQRAVALAQELERQLAEARKLAVTIKDGRMALSAVSLAGIEAQLLPQIDEAREQARSRTVPLLVSQIAGPGARDVWEGLDLGQRRVVLRAVVCVRVYPAGRGVRSIRPGRVQFEWLY